MTESFVLNENHIKILKKMSWQWSELDHGGPCVDGKRPFGFSSGVGEDIYRIVNDLDEDQELELDDDVEEEMMTLYQECFTALMVILSAETFATGLYVKDDDGEWEMVSDLAQRQV